MMWELRKPFYFHSFYLTYFMAEAWAWLKLRVDLNNWTIMLTVQDKAKIRCFTDRQTDGQHGIIFRIPPIPVMKYHIITCGLHYANYYRERILKSEMFSQSAISQRSFFTLLWERIKDFLWHAKIHCRSIYKGIMWCCLSAWRATFIWFILRVIWIIISIMQRKFPFSAL